MGYVEKPNLPRSWWIPLCIAAAMAVSYGLINGYLPQTALSHFANAGWFFTANFGVQILLRLIANRSLDRYPRQVLLGFGSVLIALSTICVVYWLNDVGLGICGLFYGIGSFYTTPSLVTWLVDLSPTRKGESMAVYNSAFGMGVAVGSMALGPIFMLVHASSTPFWVAGILAAFGLLSLFTSGTPEIVEH